MRLELQATNRAEWRNWLAVNHKSTKEIWLIFFKKHTGKIGISYEEAVEEALCFGWIDSIIKRIDDERFSQKFSPRKTKSHWSALNKKRVETLINSGRMTNAGLEKIKTAKTDGSWNSQPTSKQSYTMPLELYSGLAKKPQAKTFFDRLAPSYQKQFIGWIESAKKSETRQKRTKEALILLAKGQKLGLK